MKKKRKNIIWIVAIVLVIIFIAVGASDSEDSTTPTVKEETSKEKARDTYEQETEAEIKEETEVTDDSVDEDVNNESVVTVNSDTLDAIPVGGKEFDSYIHLGESYTSTDGSITMDIIDIDYSINGILNNGDTAYASIDVYVVVEITNNGDQDIYLDQSCAMLFVDDYEVSRNVELYQQNGYYICEGNIFEGVSYPTVVNIRSGGRKGTIIFPATFYQDSNITETSEIDFEISGLVFKINPRFILNAFSELHGTGEEVETELSGMTTVEAHDGVYEIDDPSSDAVITISGNTFSAHYSEGDDIENALFTLKDATVPNYYVISGSGFNITFYGETGLSVDGGEFGGWYDKIE